MIGIPLMCDNIDKSDIDCLIGFLQTNDRFTNGSKVRKFEQAWSSWLGVKHSLFVNSGSSANFMTMAGVHEAYGEGEVILSPIGWSSDVSAVLAAGLKPVFVDVNLENMAMNEDEVIAKITAKTRAVLLTHVLGFNGMTQKIREACRQKNVMLVEDVCESHGAENVCSGGGVQKLGSIGDVSNFSFYYAHHMSTIEGGMICTNDDSFYNLMRMYRSHGMLRECDDENFKKAIAEEHPGLYPEFIFMVPGYNMRSTELNAVIGLNQIKRLDKNIQMRRENYDIFISNLDPEKYYTDFDSEGNSNYAFVVMLRNEDRQMFQKLVDTLRDERVEFRRGTAGGGNLLRQPFIKKRLPGIKAEEYENAEHIHQFALYTGNYPGLEREKILALCKLLNSI